MNGLPGLLHRGACTLAVVGYFLVAVPAMAQGGAPDLWTKRDMPPGLTPPPEVLNSIAVNVKVGILRSSLRLSLPMPDGSKLPATRSRLAEMPKGFVWSGTIDKQTIGSASFSVVNETMAGSILTGKGQSFRLRRDPSGVYLLEEIDLRKLPPEGAPTPVSGLRDDKGNDLAADTCATDSGDDIDVMVVYTTAARMGSGSVDAIEADIYLAVELANQTYINSDINQRLRLVHLAEVSYAESNDSVTDRDRLKAGLISNVHSLRDSHGADLVALITETLGSDCGRSYTMDPVGNAFESSAFAVVKRNCMSAAGKYSLAHELGHPMSARHDWNDDGNNNSPFAYNHGHVEPGPGWRTVMAYGTLCPASSNDSCPRVLNWSNPNISIVQVPTGVGSGNEQQDNHRVLNDTAYTVANFRCALPGPPNRTDTWMKDTWSDAGSEPDPAQAGRPMWESPYIWVRRTQDTPLLTHQHDHENPVAGHQNFIYVKLHNGGGAPNSGNLDIRVANATVGLGWPGSWTAVPGAPVPYTLPAHTTRIVEVPWTPSSSGHFCLVARWDSTSDPMTTPEGSDIDVNVRGNNNIVWRNVQLIDLGDADANADAAFGVPGVGAKREFVLAIRPVPTRRPAGARVPGYMDFGRIMLTLDDRLMEAWKRTSYKGTGLRRDGSTIIVLDPKGAQLTLGALSEPGQARILFSRPKDGNFPRDEFGWRVIQSPAGDSRPQASGGITYRVRTYAR